jgi:hypothetical protein
MFFLKYISTLLLFYSSLVLAEQNNLKIQTGEAQFTGREMFTTMLKQIEAPSNNFISYITSGIYKDEVLDNIFTLGESSDFDFSIFLAIFDEYGNPIYTCSGFLLSKEYIGTAQHCVNLGPNSTIGKISVYSLKNGIISAHLGDITDPRHIFLRTTEDNDIRKLLKNSDYKNDLEKYFNHEAHLRHVDMAILKFDLSLMPEKQLPFIPKIIQNSEQLLQLINEGNVVNYAGFPSFSRQIQKGMYFRYSPGQCNLVWFYNEIGLIDCLPSPNLSGAPIFITDKKSNQIFLIGALSGNLDSEFLAVNFGRESYRGIPPSLIDYEKAIIQIDSYKEGSIIPFQINGTTFSPITREHFRFSNSEGLPLGLGAFN